MKLRNLAILTAVPLLAVTCSLMTVHSAIALSLDPQIHENARPVDDADHDRTTFSLTGVTSASGDGNLADDKTLNLSNQPEGIEGQVAIAPEKLLPFHPDFTKAAGELGVTEDYLKIALHVPTTTPMPSQPVPPN
ncbi:MAG: hypothetical protein HC799_16955 [Limnothrix sp. RL_2_0]|nr:hypothetical protein [Limnothrix sp. RL_2_0]